MKYLEVVIPIFFISLGINGLLKIVDGIDPTLPKEIMIFVFLVNIIGFTFVLMTKIVEKL